MKLHRVVPVASTLILFLALAPPVPAQETAEELYQAGLYQEEVQGNLERAIGLYERILGEFPSNRSVAANALMHIGLCHEKRGSQEAQQAYQRLLRDYADQISVADRARVRLASLQGLARVEAPVETAPGRGIAVRHLFGGHSGDDLETTGTPSPDGRYLVGVVWGPAASNIAVRDLVTGESRQLTDLPNYGEGMVLGTSLSPDGNTIAYWWVSADEQSAEVRLAFLDGSPPQTLFADPGYFYVPGPWRSDGQSVLVSRRSNGVVEFGWGSLDEGAFHAFETVSQSEPGKGRLTLSPDDRYLAFDVGVASDSERRDIYMISTDGGPEISVVRHPANDHVIGWVPGTDDLLFISDRGGKWDLYAVEVAEGEVRGDPWIVQRDVGQMGPMGFTPDGDLYFEIYTLRMFISIAPFDPETGAVDAEGARPLLGSKARPSFSPDGRYLTYWNKKDHPTNPSDWQQVLGITDLVTGEERELAAHLEVEDPRWSLDGQSILAMAVELDRREDQGPGFYRIDPHTGDAVELLRFPLQKNWYWEIGATQAPNGRDIVYVRDGRLVLHEVASGAETELYRHPGITSRLLAPSPDGQSLLFAVQDTLWSGLELRTVDGLQDGRGRLMLARLPNWETWEVLTVDLEEGTRIRSVDWAPDGSYVYFTETSGDQGTALNRVPISGGDPEMVWVSREPIGELNLCPTGDRVAFTIGENTGDTYIMENLKAALQQMREHR
ncbi:MAG: tetratricopeptide repeat protein [Gemmatimonadota bacterium]|jgi:Tol biopolymer transport system component